MRALFLLLVAQLVVSLSGALYLSRTYYWGLRAVLLHLALVAGLLLAIALVLGMSLRVRGIRGSAALRRVLLLVPAAFSCALIVLYVADDVSNRLWLRNLNFEAVSAHVGQLVTTGHGLVPLSGWTYACLAGVFALIAFAYQRLAGPVWGGLGATVGPGPGRRWASPRIAASIAASTLLIWTVTGVYVAKVAATPSDNLLLRFEPLTSFFIPVTEVSFEATAAERAALRLRQSRERASYGTGRRFDKRHVIVIMIDSARADHLQVYGYDRPTTPFLQRLADSGRLRLVQTALSTCSESNCGIMSTLSSQSYRDLAVDNFKLYDVLRDQGYRLYFLLSGTHSWYGLKHYYAEKPDVLFDGTNSLRYPASDDRVLFEGLDSVPASDGTPAFFQFHLVSPHEGGVQQDRFRTYRPADVDWATALFRAPDREAMINWQDNGVRQADAIVEELFAVLERKGYLRDSLVVLLSDHGEGFGEHGASWRYFGHTRLLYQEHIRIPLMIYDTPDAPYLNLEFATQMDVAPTILDRLGLPIPRSWRGRSLRAPAAPRYTFHQSTEYPPIHMVAFHAPGVLYKLLRSHSGREELYDLASDPLERRNVIDTAPADLVGRLRAELAAYRLGHAQGPSER